MLSTLLRLDALLTQYVSRCDVPPAMRNIEHPVLVRGENLPLCVYDVENVTSGLPSWVDLSRLEDVVFDDDEVSSKRAEETQEFLRDLGWKGESAGGLIS